ncbi:hypothetical protein HN587_07260 [Candidatus Woesearchaeota archaeon]|jgi:hypothetical protein|nr:hypothetical protein [Candidatus Woesearchaeota archaeon]
MAKKKPGLMEKIGSWAFIIGVIIAIVAGFFSIGAVMTSILIVLGLIVGFLNVTSNETNNFLFAALVLVVVSGFGGGMLGNVQTVGPYLQRIFAALLTFVVPATVIVALKSIYALAKDD